MNNEKNKEPVAGGGGGGGGNKQASMSVNIAATGDIIPVDDTQIKQRIITLPSNSSKADYRALNLMKAREAKKKRKTPDTPTPEVNEPKRPKNVPDEITNNSDGVIDVVDGDSEDDDGEPVNNGTWFPLDKVYGSAKFILNTMLLAASVAALTKSRDYILNFADGMTVKNDTSKKNIDINKWLK